MMIFLSHCAQPSKKKKKSDGSCPDITLALAGNANVGKSALFNQLTGGEQVLGNWPDKTVVKAEGILHHGGKTIRVLDLPGIYSLSTYSIEERVAREFIAIERPDVVINVVDATALERNLFFTLQLLEMDVPVVVALNLFDIAKKKGIKINPAKLSRLLGVPVVITIATKGQGIREIIDNAIEISDKSKKTLHKVRYGPEVEERVKKIRSMLRGKDLKYSRRWTAIKMLEDDTEIIELVNKIDPKIAETAKDLSQEIADIHGEPASTVISAERYSVASRIGVRVQTHTKPIKPTLEERLDNLTMHGVYGYVIVFLLMLSIIAFLSLFGGWLSGLIQSGFEALNPHVAGFLPSLLWNGGVIGFYAALSVALGFILPFYIILGVMEDSGYLPKVAYLLDRPCHAMGLHGKAAMPQPLLSTGLHSKLNTGLDCSPF